MLLSQLFEDQADLTGRSISGRSPIENSFVLASVTFHKTGKLFGRGMLTQQTLLFCLLTESDRSKFFSLCLDLFSKSLRQQCVAFIPKLLLRVCRQLTKAPETPSKAPAKETDEHQGNDDHQHGRFGLPTCPQDSTERAKNGQDNRDKPNFRQRFQVQSFCSARHGSLIPSEHDDVPSGL